MGIRSELGKTDPRRPSPYAHDALALPDAGLLQRPFGWGLAFSVLKVMIHSSSGPMLVAYLHYKGTLVVNELWDVTRAKVEIVIRQLSKLWGAASEAVQKATIALTWILFVMVLLQVVILRDISVFSTCQFFPSPLTNTYYT